MSSFTKSGRSSRMWRKLAKPAPASSTATRTSRPSARHRRAERGVVLDRDVLGHLEHGRADARVAGNPPGDGRSSSRSGRDIQAEPAGSGQTRRRREGGGQSRPTRARDRGPTAAASANRRSGRVPSSNRVSASWPDRRPGRQVDDRLEDRLERAAARGWPRARRGSRRVAVGRGSRGRAGPRPRRRRTRGPAVGRRGR